MAHAPEMTAAKPETGLGLKEIPVLIDQFHADGLTVHIDRVVGSMALTHTTSPGRSR